jgi:hypothetical protein
LVGEATVTSSAHLAARSSVVAGIAAAAANALLVAYIALQHLRPGAISTTLGPLAGVLGGLGAALLIPVAVALGDGLLAVLGGAAMVILSASWFMLAAEVLTPWAAAPTVAGAAALLAAWLIVINSRTERIPPHVTRFGRRCGAAAFAGSLVVAAALVLLPPMSREQLVALVLGGVPAGLAWLAVPAWSIGVGRALGRGAAGSASGEAAPRMRPV